MSMDEYKARKIVHKSARIPDPTPPLIDAVAQVAYMTFASHMAELLESNMPHYNEISDTYLDAWRAVAKSAYTIVAIAGGAKIEAIE